MKYQEALNKVVIQRRDDEDFPYNVQLRTSVDGGRTWLYCGIGRFCETSKGAKLMRDLFIRNYPCVNCIELEDCRTYHHIFKDFWEEVTVQGD